MESGKEALKMFDNAIFTEEAVRYRETKLPYSKVAGIVHNDKEMRIIDRDGTIYDLGLLVDSGTKNDKDPLGNAEKFSKGQKKLYCF